MKNNYQEFEGGADRDGDLEPDVETSTSEGVDSGGVDEKHQSVEDEKHWGRLLINPSINAGMTYETLYPTRKEYTRDVMDALEWQVDQVEKGDLSQLAEILTTQAFTLNSLFNLSVQLARHPDQGFQYSELYYRVAFRAQAQAVKAIEAVAKIQRSDAGKGQPTQEASEAEQESGKNVPPLGSREVDGGATFTNHFSKTESQSDQPHAPLDPRSPRKAVPGHSKVAAVDRIDGTSNRRR